MNDKQITSFITVVESGSFAKAARALFISPQALYQQIELLEAEIGCPLLARNARGVNTTPEGEVFFRGSKALMNTHNELLLKTRRVHRHVHSTVRICLCANYRDDYLLNLLRGPIASLYPQMTVEIIAVHTGTQCLSMVASGEMDMTIMPQLPCIAENDLCFQPAAQADYQWGCLMADHHPLRGRQTLALEDLDQGDFFYYYAEGIEGLLTALQAQAMGSRAKHFAHLDTFDMEFGSISDICFHGGLFLMPKMMANAFAYLHFTPLEFDIPMRFGLVYRREPAPAIERFLQIYRAGLR